MSKKLLLVCRGHPLHRAGGMLFVFADRAEELARQGYEVHLATTSIKDGGPAERQHNGTTIHFLPCESMAYSDRFAQCCQELTNWLKPKAVHLDSLDRARAGWWQDLDVPVGISMHGFEPGAFLTAWTLHRLGKAPVPTFPADELKQEAEALRKADVVIAISRHEHWLMRSWYGLPSPKLVWNPIANFFFTDPPAAQGEGFIAIGNPSTSGNRMFGLAVDAGRELGVQVRVLSKAKRRDMPLELDRAKALVLPTAWQQGFDLAVCEALARRRPVIVSDVGSYGRLADHEPGLVTFPCGDIHELKKCMAGPLPTVGEQAAEQHRPEVHVRNWLEAMAL